MTMTDFTRTTKKNPGNKRTNKRKKI